MIKKSRIKEVPFDGEIVSMDNVANIQKFDNKELDALSSSSKFLPRLQFMISMSEKCKSGEFPINHFAFIKDQNYEDIGEEVDVIPICWRPKAIDFSGEEIITVYDRKADENNQSTGEFKRIEEKAPEKGSDCMFGSEFLIWVPEKESFALFFCGSPTLRREASNINNYLGKPATFKPQKIETKKYTYYSATMVKCATSLQLPPNDVFQATVNDFNNPPEQTVERVDEGEDSDNVADRD
jgi:hypothetical protein